MKKTFILITSLILILVFTSCITTSNNIYKVTYYIGEEVYYETEVKENEKVENIKVPEIEYYELKNWLNKETNELYDFSLPLKSDLELVARYSKIVNLAGGEEGKHYDFSNLTDEEYIEIVGKLEDFLIDNAIAIPLCSEYNLSLLNNRIEYPVSLYLKGFELYSKFTGESVFRYGVNQNSFNLANFNNTTNLNLISCGLYQYEYTENFEDYNLLPYFAKDDPVCLDEQGYVWKVYIDEGFKFSDGSDVKFEDFVNAYEYNLQNDISLAPWFFIIKNSRKYFNKECKREEVGIEYNYEEKSITFTLENVSTKEGIKRNLSQKTFAPVPYFVIEENSDYSTYKFVGEYVLKSFNNNVLKYEKNPYYFNKNGVLKTFDKVEYHLYSNENEVYNNFLNGQVDMIDLSNDLETENIFSHINKIETLDSSYFLFIKQFDIEDYPSTNGENPINKILLNNNLRKALYYGIDRTKFVGNQYVPQDKFLPKGIVLTDKLTTVYPSQNNENYSFNQELALAYYLKALDELILSNEIENKEGTVIELDVLYSVDMDIENIFTEYEKLFNSQEKYKNITIKFNLSKMSRSDLYYHEINLDYDIILSSIYPGTQVSDALYPWSGPHLSSDTFLCYSSLTTKAYKESLIEFNNELFTYDALVTLLNDRINNIVYIKNGKISDIK